MMQYPRRENMQFANKEEFNGALYYSSMFRVFYRRKLEMLCDYLPAKRVEGILEVGFGTGIALRELSGHAQEVWGVDIHDKIPFVEHMLVQEKIPNVRLFRHNIFEHAFETKQNFDLAFAASVLEHVDAAGVRRGVAHIHRCLKEGGTFLVGFPLKNWIMDNYFRLYQSTYMKMKEKELYQFYIEEDHPSGQQEILPAVEQYFMIEEKRYFLNNAIKVYVCLKCRKK